jgi:hypothetical protein
MTYPAQIAASGIQPGHFISGGSGRTNLNIQYNQYDSDIGVVFSGILGDMLGESIPVNKGQNLPVEDMLTGLNGEKFPFSGNNSPPEIALFNGNTPILPRLTDSEIAIDSDNNVNVVETAEIIQNIALSADKEINPSRSLDLNILRGNGLLPYQQSIYKEQPGISKETPVAAPVNDDNSGDSLDLIAKQQLFSDSKLPNFAATVALGVHPQFTQNSQLTGKYSEQGYSGLKFDQLVTESTNITSAVPGQNSILMETKSPNQQVLALHVTSAHWATDFGDRVRWLIGNQIQKAELTLNPRSLGAVEISISVQNDQTSIQIVAQNPLSKDVVESSLWRLREMLEDAGVNLANVDVSQHSNQEKPSSEHDLKHYSKQYDDVTVITSPISEKRISDHNTLIDIYA